ncbi:hypothetical protein AVEN_222153-1, partial [Araneus ventricosus]
MTNAWRCITLYPLFSFCGWKEKMEP